MYVQVMFAKFADEQLKKKETCPLNQTLSRGIQFLSFFKQLRSTQRASEERV